MSFWFSSAWSLFALMGIAKAMMAPAETQMQFPSLREGILLLP